MWKRKQIQKHWKRAISGGSGSSKIFASRHHLLLMTKKVPKAKFCQNFCLISQKKKVNLSKIELWTVLVMLKGQHFNIKIYFAIFTPYSLSVRKRKRKQKKKRKL